MSMIEDYNKQILENLQQLNKKNTKGPSWQFYVAIFSSILAISGYVMYVGGWKAKVELTNEALKSAIIENTNTFKTMMKEHCEDANKRFKQLEEAAIGPVNVHTTAIAVIENTINNLDKKVTEQSKDIKSILSRVKNL